MLSKIKINSLIIITIILLLPTIAYAQTASIQIPSIGISSQTVPLYIKGTTWDTSELRQAVGYLTGTSWFGQGGNVVLGAHSVGLDNNPDVFYDLEHIQVGDVIDVTADGQMYQYVVQSLELVHPSNIESILPTAHEQLTLITCDVSSFDGTSYQQRLIVRAVRT